MDARRRGAHCTRKLLLSSAGAERALLLLPIVATISALLRVTTARTQAWQRAQRAASDYG